MKTLTANGWDIEVLLSKEDPELERMFHSGSPAYSDSRMTDFLSRLPYFKEQLTSPRNHVTRQLLAKTEQTVTAKSAMLLQF